MIGIYHMTTGSNLYTSIPFSKTLHKNVNGRYFTDFVNPEGGAGLECLNLAGASGFRGFNENSRLVIERSRISFLGASGLREAPNPVDFGSWYAVIGRTYNQNGSPYTNTIMIHGRNFNEWTVCHRVMEPKIDGELKGYKLSVVGITFSYDSLEIQDAFNGQQYCPVLEIEIKAAGAYLAGGVLA